MADKFVKSRWGCAAGVIVAAPLLSAAMLIPDPPRSPRQVVYDYMVTSYCSIGGSEIQAGYEAELRLITARFYRNPRDASAAKLAGWSDADAEWANRGLGGFKGWCRTEGRAAAERFRAIARGELKL